ncbi:ABC transporter [Niastella yeongjuensis]|uniref:ABC transporter n=1 Tax=Niastella yeongjuensis TaxID=354355 RepID=A0A1V9EUI8_9BACT|nr:ABC transporter permease [Niastella yeongjuensis]OQP49818.1 ABC transporter [Niastella yeongjuensis]SEP40008.1 lipoprotein-releasing system permease protein [Niastella yeongjuensis]
MMLPVNWKIMKVHLLSRKRQTIVAMLGVTFGIGMFILMMSFMKGMNDFFEDIMLSVTPDIRIYNDYKTDYSSSVTGQYLGARPKNWIIVRHPRPRQINLNLKNAPGIIEDLRKQNEIQVVSPLVSAQVLFNYGPVQLSALLDGVDIREEDRLFGLSDKMASGRPENLLTSDNGILLGYKLAKKLNVRTGDLVTATAPSGIQLRFRVVGLYKFGIATMDEFKAYVSLTDMQQLLGKSRDYITDIRLKLKDMKQAAVKAPALAKRYGYKADDWETVNASIKAGNLIRDTFTYVLNFTLLLIAGFGIYNIMNMVILGKLKDIAILKAEGFARKDIVQIFLSQSLIIGLIGSVAGLLLGFLLSYSLSKVPWPEDEYIVIKRFPVNFDTLYYMVGLIFGLLTTGIAGLLPALKASRVDPVAILRG